MDDGIVAVVFVVALVGGLMFGVRAIHRAALSSARRACEDAARVLSLHADAMDGESAAEVFGLSPRQVLSDVVAFRGLVAGVDVRVGAFQHESNTAFNGALIPIVATHVVATVDRALPGATCIRRRVFGMPKSDVELDSSLASEVLVECDRPAELAAVLGPNVALQRAIVDYLRAGEGSAFVEGACVRTMVARRDPARVRDAARRSARLAGEISRVATGHAYR